MNNRRLKGLPSWKRIRLVEYYIHLMYRTLIIKQNTSKTEEQDKLRKTFFRVVLRMERTLRCCNKEEIPVILDFIKDCPDLMFKQFILLSLRKTGHYIECVEDGNSIQL